MLRSQLLDAQHAARGQRPLAGLDRFGPAGADGVFEPTAAAEDHVPGLSGLLDEVDGHEPVLGARLVDDTLDLLDLLGVHAFSFPFG